MLLVYVLKLLIYRDLKHIFLVIMETSALANEI